jgi:hypothetical protein
VTISRINRSTKLEKRKEEECETTERDMQEEEGQKRQERKSTMGYPGRAAGP